MELSNAILTTREWIERVTVELRTIQHLYDNAPRDIPDCSPSWSELLMAPDEFYFEPSFIFPPPSDISQSNQNSSSPNNDSRQNQVSSDSQTEAAKTNGTSRAMQLIQSLLRTPSPSVMNKRDRAIQITNNFQTLHQILNKDDAVSSKAIQLMVDTSLAIKQHDLANKLGGVLLDMTMQFHALAMKLGIYRQVMEVWYFFATFFAYWWLVFMIGMVHSIVAVIRDKPLDCVKPKIR